jgi:hypothetical protein
MPRLIATFGRWDKAPTMDSNSSRREVLAGAA